MIKVLYTKDFVKMLKHLPKDVQDLYLKNEEILKTDWRDSRLHVKKLKGQVNVFSFRITRSYRALFYFRSDDEITLFAIGDRKDIYKKQLK